MQINFLLYRMLYVLILQVEIRLDAVYYFVQIRNCDYIEKLVT